MRRRTWGGEYTGARRLRPRCYRSAVAGGSKHLTVVYAAMVANGIIAVAKFVAAAATGSSAMLSEGIHSVADTANQGLLVLGDKRSRKPPDERHPFGYGPEIYFWSLIVAIVLFGLGGGLSIFEGVSALGGEGHGGEMADPTWNYVVLGIGVVVESVALWLAVRALRKRYPELSIWEGMRRSRDPRIFVPLGEDAAALAGLAVAFVGIFLAHRLGMPEFDAAASIVIGFILCGVAVFLAYETRTLLVGEQIDRELLSRIRDTVSADPAVARVRRVLTMQLSPDEVLVNIDLVFGDLGGSDPAAVVDRMEARLREIDPSLSRVFIEPERPDDPP